MKRFKIFILIIVILSAGFGFWFVKSANAAEILNENFDNLSCYDPYYNNHCYIPPPVNWATDNGIWMVGRLCSGAYRGSGTYAGAAFTIDAYSLPALVATKGLSMVTAGNYTLTFWVRNAGSCVGGGNYTGLKVYRSTSQVARGTQIGSTFVITSTSFSQKTINFTVPSNGTYYIQFDELSGSNDQIIIDDVIVNETIINNAPTISSIADAPDPVVVGNPVTFTVNWADSGDLTRTHICKTNYISGQVCTGGSWCDTATFSGTSPSSCSYTAQSGDVGTKQYYVFVCDDQSSCSSSSAGNFTVQGVSVPSVNTNVSTSTFDRDNNQAALNGAITSTGGATITQTRFCWSTTPNISTCSNIVAGNVATNFSGNLTGMTAGQIYYYKAQAYNSAGWSVLSSTNERAVVVFTADGSQQTFNTCLCTTNTVGGCCDGCNYCPAGKVNNGSGQCVDPSATYYCGVQNSCVANSCSGVKYYLSCNGSGSCRTSTEGSYSPTIYAPQGYVFDSSCNNINYNVCGYSGYNKCGGAGSPYSCQKGRDQYRCNGSGTCNYDVGDDFTNVAAGYVCSGGSEVAANATSSCGFSGYNGRSTDKCEKKKDYLACNGSNVCSYGDYGDAYDNVSAYKIANASGQEIDATSEDNTGTCHSCTEGACSGYYRWGECDGSGNADNYCTYYQEQAVYAQAGYTLTSECVATGTTLCASNQCRDGSGWHHLCSQGCDASHNCTYWSDSSCVDHCINGTKDCDEVQLNCGGSCAPCTPPTTTIQCNGSACSSAGWYRENISINLVCTPSGTTTCAATYYCMDQTNSCTPTTQGTSFTFSTEGASNYIRFYSVDNLESSEAVKSQLVKLDKTGPSSEITSPEADSNQSVNFDVLVEDIDTGGSGLGTCYFMVTDSVAGQTRSSTERTCNSSALITVGVGQDCRTVGGYCTVFAYSYDVAGNPSGISARSFDIVPSDTIRPTTAIISPSDGSWQRVDFNVLISDSDAGGSGLAENCEYMIDDLANGKNTGVKTRPCGSSTVAVDVGSLAGDDCSEDRTGVRGEATCKVSSKAYDNIGNNSGWKSRNYRIDYTAPSIGRISCAANSGQICSPGSDCTSAEQGVEKSFCATLQDPVGRITGCWLYVDGQYKKDAVFSPLPCENNAECGVSVNYAFQTSGDHTMRFSCKDAAGNYGWGEPVTVEVIVNHAPTINSLRYTTSPCEFPTTDPSCMVNFIVSASDEDGDHLTYSWIFDDGGFSTNQNPSHHYAAVNNSPGYQVSITVSDERGGTASRTIVVPVVELGEECSEGQTKTCSDCSSQICQADGTWGPCTSFGTCSPTSCSCPQSRCIGTSYYSYPAHGSCLTSCDCNTGTGPGQPCQVTINPGASECTTLSVDLRVSNKTLEADLINPSNWLNILSNLTVNSSFSAIAVVSGSAVGTVNFKFDMNRDGTYETTFSNVPFTGQNDTDWIPRQDDQGITRQTRRLIGSDVFIVKDLASYNQSGSHSPKVFVERGEKSAEDSANVGVSSTPPEASVSCNNSQCGPGSSCSPDIAYNRNCAFSYGNESTDSGNDIKKSVWSIFYSDDTPWADPYLSCTDIVGTPDNEALCDLTLPPLTASRSYYISLYVEDGARSSDSTTRSFYVRREAIADFECARTEDGEGEDCESLINSAGEVVYFRDKSLGSEISGGDTASISSWSWIFKDGTPPSDTIQNPFVSFEKVDQDSGKAWLDVTDTSGRGDDSLQQVFPRVPLPGWQEVVPTE